jgi:hypothetical protein
MKVNEGKKKIKKLVKKWFFAGLGGGNKLRWQDDAGILAAGKARARRISAGICNKRATPPAAKRPSQVDTLIDYRLLSGMPAAIGFVFLSQF